MISLQKTFFRMALKKKRRDNKSKRTKTKKAHKRKHYFMKKGDKKQAFKCINESMNNSEQ